jgi:hypothetical protein
LTRLREYNHTTKEIYQLPSPTDRLQRGAAWNFKHFCYPQSLSPISETCSRSQRPLTTRPIRDDQSAPHSGSMALMRTSEAGDLANVFANREGCAWRQTMPRKTIGLHSVSALLNPSARNTCRRSHIFRCGTARWRLQGGSDTLLQATCRKHRRTGVL